LFVVRGGRSFPTVSPRSTDQHTTEDTGQPSRWKTVLVVVAAVLVVGMLLALHLTGVVGPGAH